MLVAMGDYLGGFSLYVMHGKPRFTYSFLGLKIDTIEGADALPTGSVRVAYEFVADNPGQKATGGLGRLLVNVREVAKGRIEHTVPGQFSSYAGRAATTACRSFPSSSTPSRSPSRHRRRSRLSISSSSEPMDLGRTTSSGHAGAAPSVTSTRCCAARGFAVGCIQITAEADREMKDREARKAPVVPLFVRQGHRIVLVEEGQSDLLAPHGRAVADTAYAIARVQATLA